MNPVYERNKYYLSNKEQERIGQFNILLAGCGIGSNISECALRLGFEKQTLIDGDTVDLSNLNRQNYVADNLQRTKSDSLKRRLLAINPNAKIESQSIFLNNENVEACIDGHDIAVNALDFQSDVPFRFDELCQSRRIPVLHPYNIGWGTLVFVIKPDGPNLSSISTEHEGFEKNVASFLIQNISSNAKIWVKDILQQYEENGNGQPPPQLAVGSWLAAGACTNIMYKLATNQPVKAFPDFYFLSTEV